MPNMPQLDPQCAFCQIIAKQSPASRVYEDERVTALIPLNPYTPGHTIVIPNTHAQSILELEDGTMMHMAKVAKDIASAIKKSEFQAGGINLWLSDGEKAGQEVLHVHLHIIPRFEGDRFYVNFHSDHQNSDREKLDLMAQKIRTHL